MAAMPVLLSAYYLVGIFNKYMKVGASCHNDYTWVLLHVIYMYVNALVTDLYGTDRFLRLSRALSGC